MMDRATRRAWVDRGFKDPVQAYRAHAVSAGQRGIEFKLTFAEWWELWEPHYEQRGRATGQKCMCRTGDVGPYAVGNVRIDTVKGNHEERSQVFRQGNVAAGRLPLAQDRTLPAPDEWLSRRKWVFDPYVEEEGA